MNGKKLEVFERREREKRERMKERKGKNSLQLQCKRSTDFRVTILIDFYCPINYVAFNFFKFNFNLLNSKKILIFKSKKSSHPS